MLSSFIVREQIYVDRPPLTLIAEDEAASTDYNKMPSQTTEPPTVMYVRSDIFTIVENLLTNTISIGRAASDTTKKHVAKKITRNPRSLTQTTDPINKNSRSKDTLENGV